MSQFYEQQKGWNKAWSHTQCPPYCHSGPINIFHQTNLTNHYHVVTQANSNQVELQSHTDNSPVQNGGSQASSDCRKKGTWTEDEHRLFLFGLDKYGKGAWKSISRHVLPSKTPTQVASHAQKYFLRQKAKEKKRRSIHDITLSDKDMVHHHIDQK